MVVRQSVPEGIHLEVEASRSFACAGLEVAVLHLAASVVRLQVPVVVPDRHSRLVVAGRAAGLGGKAVVEVLAPRTLARQRRTNQQEAMVGEVLDVAEVAVDAAASVVVERVSLAGSAIEAEAVVAGRQAMSKRMM